MSGFFALLFVIALIAMIVFMVQFARRRPGAGRKIWQSGLAAIVFMGLSMATDTPAERDASEFAKVQQAPVPVWDGSVAQRVASLTTGEGLACIPASTGKSCGGTVEGVGNISLALSENRVTMIVSNPAIEQTQFSPDLKDIPRQNVQIKQGPLAGYYVARIETNTNAQFILRNEASHQMYGN